jgi:hypothetical protein
MRQRDIKKPRINTVDGKQVRAIPIIELTQSMRKNR